MQDRHVNVMCIDMYELEPTLAHSPKGHGV